MAAKLGIQMIEMYTKMIKDEFEPVLQQLAMTETLMQQAAEIEVRQELGIYEMTIKKAKLEAELEELERQLEDFEGDHYGHDSKIKPLVKAKVAQQKNGVFKKIETTMNDMIKKVKLSGVDGDIKDVFAQLPAVISDLEKDLKLLPKPKVDKKFLEIAK